MRGLLIKDMYIMRQNVKSMLFILAVWSLFFLWGNKSGTFLISMFTMVAGISVLSMFSYDRQTKWEAYVLTMPVSRRKIVLEKYLYVIITCAAFGLLAVAVVVASQILKGRGLSMEFLLEVLLNWLIGIAITFFYNSLAIPLTYWLGVEKARMIPSVLIGASVFLFVIFASKNRGIGAVSDHEMTLIFTGAAVTTVVMMILSYFISVTIYSKNEF